MLDSNQIKVSSGDFVLNKHRSDYPIGIIEKIEDGCNPICWVDFKQTISNKKHLTICCQSDIIKQ